MTNTKFEWLGNSIATILTIVQENEILQIISFALTCLSITLTIIYTIWKWWKSASKDGKIDEDEIKDLANQIDEINSQMIKEEEEKCRNSMKK